MIGKIFGFNKKSDYFLEFDDAKGSDSAEAQPAKKEEAQPAPVETKEAKVKKEEKPKAAAKTSKKAKTAQAEDKSAANQDQERAKSTVEAISVRPEKLPSEELPSFNNGLQSTPEGMTFAPDYLMKNPSSGRRRPGPSMNMFKDMARQVGRR